jgi:hypothetical protein
MIDQVGGSLAGADVPPPIAEKGLAAAPSHIFTRVGYWSDSIASNLEAALGWWEKCAGKKSYSKARVTSSSAQWKEPLNGAMTMQT